MKLSHLIYSLRVFGSFGRGDADSLSDLDILIVPKEMNDLPSIENSMDSEIYNLFGKKPSYAWYSKSRIEEMYYSGHLFAWHLYQESKPIYAETVDFITTLGKPNSYSDAILDMRSIINILNSIKESTKLQPINTVYESGVLFVCLRNIGLIISNIVNGRFDFSLDSPFHLLKDSIPIEYSEYCILKQNRRASMRGTESIEICPVKLINILEASFLWATSKLVLLEESLCLDVTTDSIAG